MLLCLPVYIIFLHARILTSVRSAKYKYVCLFLSIFIAFYKPMSLRICSVYIRQPDANNMYGQNNRNKLGHPKKLVQFCILYFNLIEGWKRKGSKCYGIKKQIERFCNHLSLCPSIICTLQHNVYIFCAMFVQVYNKNMQHL